MEIKRSASRPSGKGPAEYLTGAVRVDPLFDPPGPARVNRDGKVVDWMDTVSDEQYALGSSSA